MRLQGTAWYNYRRQHKLRLVCISKSSHGNYRVDVLDENNHHNHHWLHPIEAASLEASGWLAINTCYESNELHSKDLLRTLIPACRNGSLQYVPVERKSATPFC